MYFRLEMVRADGTKHRGLVSFRNPMQLYDLMCDWSLLDPDILNISSKCCLPGGL
jgi:hypothetical protein